MKTRFVLAVVLVLSSAFTWLSPTIANNISADEGPPAQALQTTSLETSADWLTEIQADIQQSEYAITWQDKTYLADVSAAYQAPNRVHNLRTYFTESGIRLIPRQSQATPDWEWGLTLERYGYAGALTTVSAATLEAAETRIEYQRGALSEWYVNDERGLEQGFTIGRAPANPKGSAELVLELTLSGNLQPTMTDDGAAIDFFTRDGVRALRYDGLLAYDADGRSLSARLALHAPTIQVIVNTADATYPITIDPLATTPSWAAESNQANAWLGWAVNTAGDVNGDGYSDVAVGAPNYDGGQVDEGRVYVYHGSPAGLSSAADWTAESNVAGAALGYAANTVGDTNGDGYSDLVVGASGYSNGQANEGAAFIWYGSPTGLGPTGTASNADWMVESNQAGAALGSQVGDAGDVNGDGYSDVLVAAYLYDHGQTDEGRVFVYYGSSLGPGSSPDWMTEDNRAEAWLGYEAGSAGDINGDGFGDVVVGSPGDGTYPTNIQGYAYAFYGSATGLNPNPNWTVTNDQPLSSFGSSVGTAGDVNGDGYADVLVGAHWYDGGAGFAQGKAYLYYGAASGLGLTPSWTAQGCSQSYCDFAIPVRTAGDVNGDGYADVLIGLWLYDNGQSSEGAAFVYYGSGAGLGANPNWQTESNQTNGSFGRFVGTAGDVNGDGYADIIIGAPYYDNGQTDEGRAFVYHGSSGGLSVSANWTAEGEQANAWFGHGVDTAGDVNGDGYADVIVGAPQYDNGQVDEGRAYIYLGSPYGLNPIPIWTAESDQAGAAFGYTVGTAGDVNGDGYGDVIIGAVNYTHGEINEGAAFIWYGSANGLGVSGSPSNADWQGESNQAGAAMGFHVGSAGDINGDGWADIIVAASMYDNGQADEGRVYVYHGSAQGPSLVPNWTTEDNRAEAWLGHEVGSAGDINGDGYSDIIVGAPGNGTYPTNIQGYAYAFYGSATGLSLSPDWTVTNNQPLSRFGSSVSTAGDVNGDGYADVIVGAHWYDGGAGFAQGKIYVYYGSPTGLSQVSNWAAQECSQSYCDFGVLVRTAGDVNGDGYADIVVGAWIYDNGQSNEGAVFVYHGSGSGLSNTPNWVVESNQNNGGFGRYLNTAGDVNGDGYADVIVGSMYYDNGQTDEGAVFVYYGNSTNPSENTTITIPFASDTTWGTYDADPANGPANLLGNAQKVCLDSSHPSPCPVDATLYGSPYGGGWYANLASIPGTAWIWAPGITGATTPAEFRQYYFSKVFNIAGNPTQGSLSIATDDFSEVRLNGQIIGTTGSITDETTASAAGNSLAVFSLTEHLISGNNILTIRGQNGPPSFADPDCVSPCAYMQQPAGTVFGGSLTYVVSATAPSLSLNPRQRQNDDSAPIAMLGASDTNTFRLTALGRTPFGRGQVKLEWEVKPLGTLFDGTNTQQSSAWLDTGTAGAELNELVSNLSSNTAYHWRLRLLYHPVTTPYQQHGRWLTNPWNGWNETRLRTHVSTTPPACSPQYYESDIALVLDRSSSMNQDDKIGAAKDALSTFITDTNAPPDQLALASFAATATLDQPLTTNKAAMLAAVQAITTTSGTRIDLGLHEARLELGGVRHLPSHRKIMILLSDGHQSGGNNQLVIDEANAAKAEGVIIYTIGLGADADQDLLMTVATSPQHYYYAPTGDDLAEIYTLISTALACPNLGGQVFVDTNLDGQYTSGTDQPLAGASVNLTGPVISQTLSTNQANGNYVFPGLLTGTYTVSVEIPTGYQLTTPMSYVVNLNLNDELNNDFGFTPLATSTPTPTPTACPTAVPSPLLNNLISYWKLDEANGNAIDLHGSNHLPPVNGPGTSTGILNSARTFNGNAQYFSIPTNPSVEVGTTDFTFSTWIKLDNKSGHHAFIGKQIEAYPTFYRDYSLYYDIDFDRLIFQVAGPDGVTVTRAFANSVGSPAVNTWYFLAGGYDRINGYVWISVNGGPKQTTPFSGDVHVGPAAFMLGNVDGSAQIVKGYHAGLLDETGFWKRTLTNSELAQLYNSGNGLAYPFGSGTPACPTPTQTATPTATLTRTPTPTPTACSASPLTNGLIAYWKLDETSGTRSDSTGRGNDLTDNNSVAYNTGKIGNAAQLSAANQEYLSHTDNADLSMGDVNFTIAGWVYLDAPKMNGGIGIKGNADYYSTMEYGLGYDGPNDVFGATASYGAGGASVRAYNFGSPVTNQWYFVVFWHDAVNNQLGLSVNGIEDVIAYSGGVWNTGFDFILGGDTCCRYWNGRMDETGIWKRVLTVSERAMLYNNGIGTTYPFDGGTGTCPTPTSTPTQTRTPTPTPTGSLSPTFTPTPTRTTTVTPSPTPVPACFTGPWVYGNDFQGTVGSEWSSTITNYTPNGRRFLGQFNNQSVSLIVTQLPTHTQLKVCLDLYVIRSWDGNTVSDLTRGATGPDRWSLGVLGQPTALDTTFTNWVDYPQAYPDNYPANYPAHTGAREIGTLGYTYNGQPMDSVYRVLVTINHTDNFAVLNFSASGLQDLADESWGIGKIEVITTNGIPLGPNVVYLPLVEQ